MTTMGSHASHVAESDHRRARESYLSESGDTLDDIRRPIQISWERSRAAQVDVDHVDPAFSPTSSRASVLVRAAGPVIDQLSLELSNEPVSLILTDANGVVLMRRGGDTALLKTLDAVNLAPGFNYSEAEVGTNGIGTALEVGEPILIHGAEHYAGDLSQFSCAGALVTHPVTGGLLGVVDITTHSNHSNALLLSFAKLAASRIRERILEDASALDKALLGDYHRACQHSGGAVIALGGEVFIMNSLMQRHFDAVDQAAIIDQTRDARGRVTPFTTLAELPSGLTARFSYQPSFVEETLAGGIVQIKEHRAKAVAPTRSPSTTLPGIVGSSARWRHTVDEVLDACSRREWIIVEGEVAVGKARVLHAAHDHCAANRPLVVVDTVHADSIERVAAALDAGADVIIRHAHELPDDDLDRLADLLQSAHDDLGSQRPWVALTVLETATTDRWGTHVVGFFPRTVTVPPLRHHLEDIPALTRLLLNQAGATELTLSRPAMSQLMRLPWANNVGQLRSVLSHISHRRRSGEAGPEDLPPECHSTTRRQLTAMEAMERDAIVAAMSLHGGDKDAAAASLGMSRATIYRRIRKFGIQG